MGYEINLSSNKSVKLLKNSSILFYFIDERFFINMANLIIIVML